MDNDIREKLDNRFSEFREKTTEQLEQLREEVTNSFNDCEKIFNDPKSISEQKTDAWNEMKYETDKLEYIENLLKERKGLSR